MFSEEFKENLNCCLSAKKEYELFLRKVCDYLMECSPSDNPYYFRSNGFVCVDVGFEDIDEYTSFFEEIVKCKYTSIRNLTGVTLLVSLSTLVEVV